MEKLELAYPVIVEGKYDKIKLTSIVSSPVIAIGGFAVFNDSATLALLRRYSSRGVIVLTDSDSAGSFIRSRLKGLIGGDIINLYTSRTAGKEKRKAAPSKDGLLGVEGIDVNELRALLSPYTEDRPAKPFLDRSRAYSDGLSGRDGSAALRERLATALGLPPDLTMKALSDAINRTFTEDEYTAALRSVKEVSP